MYRLADNKISELRNWNTELLKIEIEEIEKFFDLEILGFESKAIEDIGNLNIEDFFEETSEKEKTIKTCPHCGKEI